MAFPLLLPLLFTAGSTIANTVAANQQTRAQASAMEAERIRQRQFDQESAAIAQAGMDRFQNTGEQKAERADTLADLFQQTQNAEPTEAVAALPQSDSNLVVNNDAARSSEARARTDAQGQRRADMLSFSDLFGDFARAQGRDSSQLSLLGSLRRGSQNVLPLELQAAQQRGQGLRLLGDLFNVGAGITAGPAMSGGSLFPGYFNGANPVVGPAIQGTGIAGLFNQVPRPRPRPVSLGGGV